MSASSKHYPEVPDNPRIRRAVEFKPQPEVKPFLSPKLGPKALKRRVAEAKSAKPGA